jgi:hypothetical protein
MLQLNPVMELIKMRWAGHVARVGEKRDAYREIDHMECVDVDGDNIKMVLQ